MRQLLIAGRYRLLDLVGTGGMGRVWLARDEMLHRDVAVKEVVLPGWLAEAERDDLRLRTLREARTAARLNHPNVVRIYDVVHDRDSPWIVMEYVESRSVQQILATEGPLSPCRTARIGLAVLAALRAAHTAGVLHRDVKPHNVLISPDGRVVLTDFGLATFAGGDGAMTGPGMVLGSPQFVAPERARDGVSDVRTDLWSLGATLYAAVEGQAPYARSNAMATLTALATELPDPMRRAGALRPVLTGLLQRDPWRRLTAAEAEPLLSAATGPPTSDPPRHAGAPHPAPAAQPARAPEPGTAHGAGTPPEPARTADAARSVDTPGTAVAGGADDPATGPVRPRHSAGPRRHGRRQRLAIAGMALAVTLLAAAGTVAAVAARSRAESPQAGSGGADTSTRPAAFACATPPPPAASPVASVPPPPGARFRLVSGWTWYTHPTGFRIAAPVAWLHWTEDAVTCFREPGGARVLSVEATGRRNDPLAWWRAEERRLTNDGALPGYHKVDISPMDIFDGGAVWECGWVNAAGERVHTARLLANTSADRAYTVSWLTKEFDWQVNATYFAMIRQSFTPES
ncbi:serine/threonine-protein kinase [Micromonospora sp. WMMD812]|uniref:serine/threonine-protein kinase n=1 Tax=Micromonospora sp. WMMD812 TaxID=3015152 RepID=UPI00248B809B|nr:serine/threonine-protein kinase [Micromonospora sp. WMMD812]WBB67531.1 serine/threonine-protein kinase [Micromonospora sp. WMMD812]